MERERFNTVWDRDGSLKRLLGDEALLQKMLVMFQQSNTQTLSDISLAIEKDDYQVVKGLAHKLKGSASAIGAPRVVEDCVIIESAAEHENNETIRQTFTQLQHDINGILAVIDSYLKTTPSSPT
ncbi:MAG: Hpt domain-containing protein [Pseudomonadota bacterium]|nr:Hpt domain-containing protein [Pseudomonadota bacterium]